MCRMFSYSIILYLLNFYVEISAMSSELLICFYSYRQYTDYNQGTMYTPVSGAYYSQGAPGVGQVSAHI